MKRNECIDVIKFILVSMIIVLHTIKMSCYGNYFLYGFGYLPQKLAVPLFFIISSYYFGKAINQSRSKWKIFLKYIVSWVVVYFFWSFIHLQFYEFPWYYPTRGILWFFYALIIGNVIVFLVTRIVKDKTLLIINMEYCAHYFYGISRWLVWLFDKNTNTRQTYNRIL